MNKKVVAFLSLFSFALVLSVYYVTLPITKAKNDQPVGNLVENVGDAYIEGLVVERVSSLQEEVQTQLEILGNSSHTVSEKVLAGEKVDQLKAQMNEEEILRTGIKSELGFASSYVETGEQVYVLAYSKTKTREEVLHIMEFIDQYYNRSVDTVVNFHS